MKMRFDSLVQPLNVAGLVTLAAVAMTLTALPQGQRPLAFGLLAAFTALMLLDDVLPALPTRLRQASLIAMGIITHALLALYPRAGALPILTVVYAAVIAGSWPPRAAVLVMLAGNVITWWILHRHGFDNALMSVVLIACFQLFAGLTVHYARTAEEARDRLALVNADLLATRALLADAARDGERIRVARELHDVAGHKLTALKINLRALASSPDAPPQLKLAEQLSGELLQDIRGVVYALHDVDGMDIAAALQALGAPMPRPRLQVTVADDVRIVDPATAETVLRVVQEALTNAARHADADHVTVRVWCEGAHVHLHVEDDGQLRGPLREGHGIAGMRERVEARGGQIGVSKTARGSLGIDVVLPA